MRLRIEFQLDSTFGQIFSSVFSGLEIFATGSADIRTKGKIKNLVDRPGKTVMIGTVQLNKNPVVDFRVIRQGRISSRYRDYLESSLLGKIKKVQIMSTDLAFELLPAQDMDEIDQLLAEVEAPEQELVQI